MRCLCCNKEINNPTEQEKINSWHSHCIKQFFGVASMPIIDISEKLYNSIVRITIKLNNEKQIAGTGFFIKVNIKNKNRYFLIACQHIIKEEYINEKKNN